MIITSENLQQVADRLGSILNKNINIMDETGTIVASTDPGRIGTFHQAAKDLIDRNVSEIDVYANDSFAGSKAGINLPLSIEGKTVGVIGVTGDPQELRDIGLVISEMAKIMFVEAIEYSRFENSEKKKQRFLEELLLGNPGKQDPEFIARGRELKIEISKIKAIVIISSPLSADSSIRDTAYESFLKRVNQSPLSACTVPHCLRLGEKVILFLTREPKPFVEEHLQNIINAVKSELDITLFCGVAGGCSTYIDINKVYSHAERALDAAYSFSIPTVCQYEKLVLEILLNQLSNSSKDLFLSSVWQAVGPEDAAEMIEFLKVYFSCNCSIAETSQCLYIHKNTVQYKLKKILELTGFDPRCIKDATVLYLCVKLAQKRSFGI